MTGVRAGRPGGGSATSVGGGLLRWWPVLLTAGLVTGPFGAAATSAAAVLVLVALRVTPRAALAAAALVVLGGAVAAARMPAPAANGAHGGAVGQPRAGEVRLSAIVLEAPRERRGGIRAARVLVTAPTRGAASPRAGTQVVVRADAGLWRDADVGEEVAARGVPGPLGPAERHQWLRGARGELRAVQLRLTGDRRGGVRGALDAVRRRAEGGLGAGLAPGRAALARGMVLGQDEALDRATRDAFRAAGLSHLLAVSGANVLLLATLVLALAALCGAPLRLRLVLVLLAIAVYVPLTGAGPSIQRAGIMGAAGVVATLAGRPAARWHALGLAAAITLAANPLAARDPGWQLSFAAVAALALWARPVAGALRDRRVPGPLADATAMTLVATMGTAPLLALRFGELSLVALPANLLAAPLVAPIMWLGTVAAALGPGLAEPVTALAEPLLAALEAVAVWMAGRPGAGLSVPAWTAAPLALALAVAALRSSPPWRPALARAPVALRSSPPWRPALVTAAVPAAAWWLVPVPASPPDPAALVVSFLDVGQGDATLLQHAGRTVLVDTGPPDGPVLRRLREAGTRRIDLLVLTHAQADHDGAAERILGRHDVGTVLDGGETRPPGRTRALRVAAGRARWVAARAGQRLRLGSLELRVLWPAAGRPTADPNDRAVVLHAHLAGFDLLLPADAESGVTLALDLPRAEALKVAHHGSEDPGLPALLARVRPQVAAIEVGAGNSYGHPRPSVLAALRARVPHVYRTDRDGTVRLTVRDGRMRVATTG